MINIAAIARPHLGAIVLTTGLLAVGGIYCATRMPSGVYPEITFSRIAVVAKKPGLDLRSMELQVTVPLEQALSTVTGVERVRSKTIRGGSELSIDFTPGTEMKRAEQLCWNRIGAARSQMPADLDFKVDQMTPSVFPILSVVLTGGDSPAKLRDYAYYELAPKVKKVPDVLYCEVSGGDLREIEVEPRPKDLLAAGLSAADLADQIGKMHRLQPVGRIEQPPLAFLPSVDTQGKNAYDISKLQIPTRNGQWVRVEDVADVNVSHQDRDNSSGYKGEDAVVLSVFRRLGGNTVNISDGIQQLLREQPPPRNVQAELAYDQSRFVNSAVDNVRDAILAGSAFSILILLVFLKSWRATLISALAIPITLCITFLFMYWLGESFNLMSLGGLAVAIGLIIDDTVVVIENIARHLARRRGDSAVDAASGEITGAVVGSTLTTVLVFVPLAFIAGVYGQFFASLSWALCIAVLVSMVISLTLIPVFAAKFLGRRPMPEPGRIYHALEHAYESVLRIALRFPWPVLVVSVAAAVVLGALLFTGIPSPQAQEPGKPPPSPLVKGLETGLLPSMDEGAFIFDYWAPTGTPLKGTVEMVKKVEEILSQNPDVQVYVRRTGSENGLYATQTNRGDITVILRDAENDPYHLLTKPLRPEWAKVKPELEQNGKEWVQKKYRRRPVTDIMDEIKHEAQEQFSEHQFRCETVQIMNDELNDMSGADKPVEIKLFGPEYGQLRELAGEFAETLENKGKGRGIESVNSNVFEGNPDLSIQVNGARAARLGLTSQEVERQLTAMYFGQVATQVRESAQRMVDVRVRYPDSLRFGPGRFDPDLLRGQLLLIPDTTSAPADPLNPFHSLDGARRSVPLSSVADVVPARNPDEESRENQKPAVFITAELKENEAGLGSVVADINRWMHEIEKDGKLPAGYRWELGGHYIKQQEAFRSLAFVMAVAVFLVFILLAFQFRSVVLPLLIFLTQPLSLVSGLFALWITNTPLNISSYMGAILLIGLDMKNGILLVEYIQRLRHEGMKLEPALLQAGRTRFRPILMTSLAAILGLFPLALGIGPGAQMQQPLAIMVIGGLVANMLFTRMVIPVGYLVMDRVVPGAVE